MSANDAYMTAMEETKDFVAMWTGVKQQFIDSGWPTEGAESMTLQIFRTQVAVKS